MTTNSLPNKPTKPTKDALTFCELLDRWNWDDSDLCREIVRGEIKPCLWISGRREGVVWEEDPDGGGHRPASADQFADGELLVELNQWLFLQGPSLISDTEALFCWVTTVRNPGEPGGSTLPPEWFQLKARIGMDVVKRHARFLQSEVESYEARHVGAAPELPDPQRRLAALRALGGDVTLAHGKWKNKGFNALAAKEREGGRPRSDTHTIRADLCKAAEAERDAIREGGHSPEAANRGTSFFPS